MRPYSHVFGVASTLAVGLLAATGTAQIVACQAGQSFPIPALVRNPLSFNTSADLHLAVSSTRIALTSNESVQLRCRSSGGKLSGANGNPFPLRGANLTSGLFVTDPPVDNLPSIARGIFDPRIIYDNYSNCFWAIASENGANSEEPYGANQVGRIHLAVSKSAAPSSWSGNDWVKCTTDFDHDPSTLPNPDKGPINIQSIVADACCHMFPDRCSIAVDKDYLFICYREAQPGLPPPPEGVLYSVILVIPKSSVIGTGPIVVEAAFRIDQGLSAHALAVDYQIDPNAAPGVYVISRGPKSGGIFTGIRFGRVSRTNGVWSYTASNYNFPNSNFQYQDQTGCSSAPGGIYTDNGDQLDTNYINNQFWSCLTRVDTDGARKVWAVQAVRPTDATEANCVSVLQWYEIPVDNPSAFVAARYTLPNGDWAHDPSMAVNANSVKMITFNRSYADPIYDPNKYPGICRLTIQGNTVTMSPELSGPPVVYRGKVRGQGGQGAVSPFWADFTGTEPDPVDTCQFWSHHMIVDGTGAGPKGVSERWQSELLRYRIDCPMLALRGNLDLDQDGELTADDVAIYAELAEDGDPEMDRTYEGQTDILDFMNFMEEWESPG